MLGYESSLNRNKIYHCGSYDQKAEVFKSCDIINCNKVQISIMGKAQKKTGKGRLDKYYRLAKYVLYY